MVNLALKEMAKIEMGINNVFKILKKDITLQNKF